MAQAGCHGRKFSFSGTERLQPLIFDRFSWATGRWYCVLYSAKQSGILNATPVVDGCKSPPSQPTAYVCTHGGGELHAMVLETRLFRAGLAHRNAVLPVTSFNTIHERRKRPLSPSSCTHSWILKVATMVPLALDRVENPPNVFDPRTSIINGGENINAPTCISPFANERQSTWPSNGGLAKSSRDSF